MFYGKQPERIIERNRLWYIETGMGYEGPFDSVSEARNYLRLKHKADSARMEFAGIEDILYKV